MNDKLTPEARKRISRQIRKTMIQMRVLSQPVVGAVVSWIGPDGCIWSEWFSQN